MANTATVASVTIESQVRALRVPVLVLGITLNIFLVLTYLLCLLFAILFPHVSISHSFVGLFVPLSEPVGWYELLTGLIEAIVAGWYFAVVFGMLYNFIVAKFDR